VEFPHIKRLYPPNRTYSKTQSNPTNVEATRGVDLTRFEVENKFLRAQGKATCALVLPRRPRSPDKPHRNNSGEEGGPIRQQSGLGSHVITISAWFLPTMRQCWYGTTTGPAFVHCGVNHTTRAFHVALPILTVEPESLSRRSNGQFICVASVFIGSVTSWRVVSQETKDFVRRFERDLGN